MTALLGSGAVGLVTSAEAQAQSANAVGQVAGQNNAQKVMGNSIDNVCPTLVGLVTATPALAATQLGELQRICTGMVRNAVVLNGGTPPDNGFDIADPNDYNGTVQSIAGEELQTPQLEVAKVRQSQVGAVRGRLGALRSAVATPQLSLNLDDSRAYRIAGLDSPVLVGPVADSSAFGAPARAGVDEADDIGGLQEASGGRFGVFMTGGYRVGDKDGTSEVEGFDFDTQSLVAGVDYRLTPNMIAGLAFGYSRFNVDFDTSTASPSGQQLDNHTYSVSLYGTWYSDKAFYIDGVARIGYGDYDTQRRIFIDNDGNVDVDGDGNAANDVDVDRTARGSFDSLFYDVGVTGGYDIDLGGPTITPKVSLDYVRAEIDGFSESGAAGLNLTFDDQTAESLTATIGASATYPISTSFGVITPSLSAGWIFELSGNDDGVQFRYSADPTGLSTFEVAAEDKDSNYGELGASLALALPNDLSAFVEYSTVVALEDTTQHAVFVGVRWGF